MRSHLLIQTNILKHINNKILSVLPIHTHHDSFTIHNVLLYEHNCQNAEPIMINGGLIAFSIGLLAIRMECFVFRDWSLKISSVFHWFLISQTTIGKHVLFELVQICCFDLIVPIKFFG